VARRRGVLIFSILILITGVALVYGTWQKPVRISSVIVYGANQSIANLVNTAIQGSYFGIIPRNSTFFVPKTRIRSLIMYTYPNVAAISIFRNGLNGLSIKIDNRSPVAKWCGVTMATSSTESILQQSEIIPTFVSAVPNTHNRECYFFDINGFVYASSSHKVSSKSLAHKHVSEKQVLPMNTFTIYDSLSSTTLSITKLANINTQIPKTSTPIGQTLSHISDFPRAFDFARQIAIFGSPVVSVVFNKTEVDDYLKSGTRIIYMLGNEKNAFTALKSADTSAKFDLSDGSVDYVDLRFSGKVYLKKLMLKI